MSNSWFNFKEFKVKQEYSAFKVGTDGVLLGAWCDLSSVMNVLDIGTGTGLIALMLAQRSKAMISALEPDRLSFDEAVRNTKDSPWTDRINIFKSTLQEFVNESDFLQRLFCFYAF